MKKNQIVFIFCIVLFGACKTNYSPDPNAPTPEQLLASSSWKIDELRFSQITSSNTGTAYFYQRGNTANISNLDNESVLFKSDHSGVYTLGATHSPLTWEFVDPGKTKLRFTITYSPTNILTVNWENLVLSAKTMRYAEHYITSEGIVSLASGARIH